MSKLVLRAGGFARTLVLCRRRSSLSHHSRSRKLF